MAIAHMISDNACTKHTVVMNALTTWLLIKNDITNLKLKKIYFCQKPTYIHVIY